MGMQSASLRTSTNCSDPKVTDDSKDCLSVNFGHTDSSPRNPKTLLHFEPITCFQGPTLPIGQRSVEPEHIRSSVATSAWLPQQTKSDMTAMLAESVSVYTPSSSLNFSMWSSMSVALCRFRRKSPCRTLRRSATAFAAALSDVNVPMCSPEPV